MLPRNPPRLLLSILVPISLSLLLAPILRLSNSLPTLTTSLAFAIIAFASTISLIPLLSATFIKAGLRGRDLLKKSDQWISESAGLICAGVYILLLILFIPFLFSDFISSPASSPSPNLQSLAQGSFPHKQLSVYLSALLCLLLSTLLGFLDDVFDIRWRHKLPIPLIASIPLLLVYHAEGGNTHVVLPIFVRSVLGRTVVDLGPLYYLYMSLLSTFSTNSINILAGLNGLEGIQALIIALSIALNDLLYIPWSFSFNLSIAQDGKPLEFGGVYGAGLSRGSPELVERHLLSLYFMIPLVGVLSGFLWHNWYPARTFPGDTLCYLSGMSFAVVGILGHFSKTLLLFFIPQVFNFVLSAPQIFGLVYCPRHRVPVILEEETRDGKEGTIKKSTSNARILLTPSRVEFHPSSPPSTLQHTILTALSFFGLTSLSYSSSSSSHKTLSQTQTQKQKQNKEREITSFTNLTLPNVILIWFGPLTEEGVVVRIAVVQVLGSCVAFGVRYGLAGLVYDGDRK